MTTKMKKEQVLEALKRMLEEKISACRVAQEVLYHGANELGNLLPEDQHTQKTEAVTMHHKQQHFQQQLADVERLERDWLLEADRVQPGALINIREGGQDYWLFLLPVGFCVQPLNVAGVQVICCTASAPKLQLLNHKGRGDTYSFGGRQGTIVELL